MVEGDHMSNKGVSPVLIRRGSRHLDASSSTSSSSSTISTRRLKRDAHRWDQDDGDRIECSKRECKSCTTGTVADCVALCLCPCAVVHFCALALVKVPWTVGKMCLGVGKKRKQKRVAMKAKVMALSAENVQNLGELTDMQSTGTGEEEDRSAEMVWMEMGQLGFGRVSFHGFQSFGSSSN